MKTCFACKKVKPLNEFYRHPKMADGHFNKCKSCSKADAKKNRADNIDQYRQYERDRRAEKKQVEARYRKTPAGKAAHDRATARYSFNHKKQRVAHNAVSNALRDGRLTRMPCGVCGSELTEAHHPDYDKPLEVIWLCREHHMQIHR